MKTTKKAKTNNAYEIEKLWRSYSENTTEKLTYQLGILLGELNFAQASKSPVEQQEALKTALDFTEKALLETRHLRYLALESRMDLEAIDISQLILEVVDEVENKLKPNTFEFTVFVEAGICALVDPVALRHALYSLIWNYTLQNKNKPSITIQLNKKGQSTTFYIGTEDFKESAMQNAEESPVNTVWYEAAKVIFNSLGGTLQRFSTNDSQSFYIDLPSPDSVTQTKFFKKRKYRRIPVQLQMELKTNENITLHGNLNILSYGGGFFHLANPHKNQLPEKEDVLQIHILFQNELIIEDAKIRVANTQASSAQSGFGFEFIDLGARARKIIHAIVYSQLG